jgi:uncharacterized membrane protein
MMEATFRILKQQRIAASCALVVGLVLVLLIHAPVLPVVLGCLFAIGLAIHRSVSKSTVNLPTREGR